MHPYLCFNTLVYDPTSSTPAQHRVTGWSHFGLRKLLRYNGVQLFIDATFNVVPDPFKQLLVIMVKDAGSEMYLPVFHVLMTGKTLFLYRFTFNLCIAALGNVIKVQTVVCDFEKALIQAIKGLFS